MFKENKMKIKFDGHNGPVESYKDILKELFYIGKYEWDDADYGFTITLFGQSWNWLIYNNKESYLEYQQIEVERELRYQNYEKAMALHN
jgi:hypothetical protein